MTSSVIVDGAAIVQMLKPAAAAKKIAEYASEIFIPYIILQLHSGPGLG